MPFQQKGSPDTLKTHVRHMPSNSTWVLNQWGSSRQPTKQALSKRAQVVPFGQLWVSPLENRKAPCFIIQFWYTYSQTCVARCNHIEGIPFCQMLSRRQLLRTLLQPTSEPAKRRAGKAQRPLKILQGCLICPPHYPFGSRWYNLWHPHSRGFLGAGS